MNQTHDNTITCQEPIDRIKQTDNLDNRAKLLRSKYLSFLNRLITQPDLVDQLGLTTLPAHPLTESHPPTPCPKPQPCYTLPKLTCRPSIQDRMCIEQPTTSACYDASSGLLISQELPQPSPSELLVSPSPLTMNTFEELFSDEEIEIGITAVLILCKYLRVNRGALRQDTMLRMFVTATNLAFKLTYEIVSQEFLEFLAIVLAADVKLVNSLERHFVEVLAYDLQVNHDNVNTLLKLL